MGDPQKKLFTWKNWLYIVPATLVGCGWTPFKEYRATGTVQTVTLVISIIVFCLGIGIGAIIQWHSNRPEPDDKPGDPT